MSANPELLNLRSVMKPRILDIINPKICLILPWFITLFGIAGVIVTRIVAYYVDPAEFARSLPTISKAASIDIATTLFAIVMTIVAIAMIIVWYLGYLATQYKINLVHKHTQQTNLHTLNVIGVIFGISSAIFLMGLANVSLEDDNDWHMYFSYLFFISQVFSFIFDTIVLAKLRRLANGKRNEFGLGFDARPWVCLAVFIDALFFYFMYSFKESPLLADFEYTRQVYVGSEYLLVMIALTYAIAYFPGIRTYITTVTDKD